MFFKLCGNMIDNGINYLDSFKKAINNFTYSYTQNTSGLNLTYASDDYRYAEIDTTLNADCGGMKIFSQISYVLKVNPTCNGISKYTNSNDKKLAVQSTFAHEIVHLYDVADITAQIANGYSTSLMGVKEIQLLHQQDLI